MTMNQNQNQSPKSSKPKSNHPWKKAFDPKTAAKHRSLEKEMARKGIK